MRTARLCAPRHARSCANRSGTRACSDRSCTTSTTAANEPGVRPRVISEELAADLDEYLSFRHVFRNLYGFELKGDRLARLSERLDGVARRFEQEIETFLAALDDVAEDAVD